MIPQLLKPFYTCEIPIRWGDMDAFGHVNNTLYFRYFEEARFLWMLDQKMPMNLDSHPVVVTIGCAFLRPLFHPDNLRIEIYIDEPGRSSFMCYYRVYSSQDSLNPTTEGYSKIVWVDKATGKSVPLPDQVRKWFSA